MVEIIPKKEVKKRRVHKIIFAFSFLILMIVVSSYFIIFFIGREREEERDILKEKIFQQDVKEINTLKAKLTRYQTKINDFKFLVEDHRYPTQFFLFLEKNTHTSVNWSSMVLNIGNRKLNLKGEAVDFTAIIEQLLILQRADGVSDVQLANMNILKEKQEGETEGIEFELNITLKSEVFSN
jgi:hypothetical protein